jgi:hypothetical protein
MAYIKNTTIEQSYVGHAESGLLDNKAQGVAPPPELILEQASEQ